MATLNIKLPEKLRQFVETQTAEGGYASPDAYVEALIRQDHKRRAEQILEAKLQEGLDSGPAIEITDEWWDAKRAELIERHRKGRDGATQDQDHTAG